MHELEAGSHNAQHLARVIKSIHAKTYDLGSQHTGKQLRELALQRMLLYWQTIRNLDSDMGVFIGEHAKGIKWIRVKMKDDVIVGTRPNRRDLQKGVAYVSVHRIDADGDHIGNHAVIVVDGHIFDCNGQLSTYAKIVRDLAPGLSIAPTRNMQSIISKTNMWRSGMVIGRGAKGWCSLWALMCMVMFDGSTDGLTALLRYIYTEAPATAALIAVRATTIMAYHHYLNVPQARKGRSSALYGQMFSASRDSAQHQVTLNKQKIVIAGSVLQIGAMTPRIVYDNPTAFIAVHIHSRLDEITIRTTLDLKLHNGIYDTRTDDFQRRIRDIYAPILGNHADVDIKFLPKYYRVVGTCGDLKRRTCGYYWEQKLKNKVQHTEMIVGQTRCRPTKQSEFATMSAGRNVEFDGHSDVVEKFRVQTVEDQVESRLPDVFKQLNIIPKNNQVKRFNKQFSQVLESRRQHDDAHARQLKIDARDYLRRHSLNDRNAVRYIINALRSRGKMQIPTIARFEQKHSAPWNVMSYVGIYRAIPDRVIQLSVSMFVQHPQRRLGNELKVKATFPAYSNNYALIQRDLVRECAVILATQSHMISRVYTPMDDDDIGHELVRNKTHECPIRVVIGRWNNSSNSAPTDTRIVTWPILPLSVKLKMRVVENNDRTSLRLFPHEHTLKNLKSYTDSNALSIAKRMVSYGGSERHDPYELYATALDTSISIDVITNILQNEYNI